MKTTIKKIVKIILNLILILGISNIYADPGLKRLTRQYEPNMWQLFPMVYNPFTYFYSTEFSIPQPTKLSIRIYEIDNTSNDKKLIYNLVKPDWEVFEPAVYDLDWTCRCDSLGLSVGSGIYRIIVKALDPNDSNLLLFQDSVETWVPPKHTF